MELLNTLYITQPEAYAQLENNTVKITINGEKKLQAPLHHFKSIVCFGEVLLSPILIHYCADAGISIVMLNRNGRFKARIEGSVSGNILLRCSHYQAANDTTICLHIAQTMVAGKIKNSRYVLMRGARDNTSIEEKSALGKSADMLAAALRNLSVAKNIDSVRGIEGQAAREYFSAINLVIKKSYREDFFIKERTRRPPMDCFNALISFLYTLVLHDCRSALESVGLDPQLGFLHVVRPGRPALALDLMEEFRSVIADRLALTLVNRAQINKKDFDLRTGGAVYLSDDSRKKVIVAYQEKKREEIPHSLLKQKIMVGLLPFLQARLLARTIRGDIPNYPPYLMK